MSIAFIAYNGRVNGSSEHLILYTLAILLALTSVAVLFRSQLLSFARQHGTQASDRTISIRTIVLGAFIGSAVSISSVGAGAIGVTALLMLFPKLPMVRIVGSDIAHAVPLALIAGAGHWFIGGVNLSLLVSLLLGSIPGVLLGSYLSSSAPERFIQYLLAVVLALSSWQLFGKAKAPAAKAFAAPASEHVSQH